MLRAPRFKALWLAAFIALTSQACDDDCDHPDCGGPPVDPDPYIEQTSAASVLHNLRKAYDERNASEYARLFDRGEFAFEFTPFDREMDPSIPALWPYDDEIDAASALFNDDTVDRIVIQFAASGAVPATESDALSGGPEGVWKVHVQGVHLEVHTIDEQGQPLEYLVEGDAADFFLREYPAELAPISHLPIWRIVYWRDEQVTGAAPGPNTTTWGAIKFLYH